MENGAFMNDLAMNSMVIFQQSVNVYQRGSHMGMSHDPGTSKYII
jgi:hypothetical protein